MTYADEVAIDNPRYWWRLSSLAGGFDLSQGVVREFVSASGTVFPSWRGISTDGWATATTTAGGRINDSATRLYVPSNNSLEFWFFPAILPTSNQVLWTNLPGSLNAGNGINWQNDQKVHFYIWNGSTLVDTASLATPNLDQWHHVVLTLGAADVRLYLDGALDRTVVQTQSATNPAQPASFMNNVGGTGTFQGWLAEPAIYQSVLSASRVLAHYDAANLKAFDPLYQGAAQGVVINTIAVDTGAILVDTADILAAVKRTY